MRNYAVIALALLLFGCQTPPENTVQDDIAPEFTAEIRQVNVDELERYWVLPSQKPKMLNSRPDWLPEGRGEWTVKTVIDSNGHIVQRTLLQSTPEGFMTQQQLDAMPKPTYAPAETNTSRIPVTFVSTAKIMPRSEL